MARKIATMMYKGGAGKTTTSINLGAALHALEQRTLVVDLDRQGNATTGVGFDLDEVPASINDLFADAARDPRTAVLETDFGLHVLAASRGLARTAMNMSPGDMFLLRRILEELDADYDFIIMDTPPNEGYMTYNALAAADEVLIPVATRGFSEEGLRQTIEGIRHAQGYNPGVRLAGVLFTNVEKGTVVASSVLQSVREDHPEALLPMAIPKAAALDKGNLAGLPGILVEPRHKAAKAYYELARRFINGDQ